MILGHTPGLPSYIYNYIYSFHMPAFFILSGFLFTLSKENTYGKIKSKFKRLIFPAWGYGLICGIPFLLMLATGKIDTSTFLNKLLGTLTGYPSVTNTFNSTPLWFLFSLFTVEFLAILLSANKRRYTIAIIASFGIAGFIISTQTSNFGLFNVFISMTSCLFFAFGMLIKIFYNQKEYNKEFYATMLFVAVLLFITLQQNKPLELAKNYIGETTLTATINVLVAISGSIILYYISYLLSSKALGWLGVNTIIIIAFNYHCNSFTSKILQLININHWVIHFIVTTILLLTLIVLKKNLIRLVQNITTKKYSLE